MRGGDNTQHCADSAARGGLTGMLAGGETFPDSQWVSDGGTFP